MSAAEAYGRLHPLYEAMSVCSMAVQELRKHDTEHKGFELLHLITGFLKHNRAFVKEASEKDLTAGMAIGEIQNATGSMRILTNMTEYAIKETRSLLPVLSERLSAALGATLDEYDGVIYEMDELVEAWQISTDKQLTSEISKAVKEIDPTKTDIPDWRNLLESVSD